MTVNHATLNVHCKPTIGEWDSLYRVKLFLMKISIVFNHKTVSCQLVAKQSVELNKNHRKSHEYSWACKQFVFLLKSSSPVIYMRSNTSSCPVADFHSWILYNEKVEDVLFKLCKHRDDFFFVPCLIERFEELASERRVNKPCNRNWREILKNWFSLGQIVVSFDIVLAVLH